MGDKRNKFIKQPSLSYIEQSLKIIPSPQTAPVTIYLAPKEASTDLSKEDIEIANRLENLRRKSTPKIPTEDEMETRLANLQGLDPNYYKKSNPVYRPDDRTDAEKADNLLHQLLEEVTLDTKREKTEVSELEKRLLELRGSNSSALKNTGVLENNENMECLSDQPKLTHEEEIEKIMQTAKSEAEASEHLKYKLSESTSSSEQESCSESEFTVSNDYKSKYSKAEVDRIVNIYAERAEQKKLRKKLNDEVSKAEVDRIVEIYAERAKQRKLRKKLKKKNKTKSDEFDLELSSDGNDTSDSEKFSSDSN